MKSHIRMFAILFLLPISCGEVAVDLPKMPRPSPPPNLDVVSKRVIQNHAKALAKNPDDVLSWRRYGDVCLINGWPAEALVSYGRAEDLGDPEAKLMNAYTLRKLNDSSAFTVAEEYFRLTQSQECAESLAEWHYEDGSLADAASWLNKTKQLSVRGASLAILIDVQMGKFDLAIEQTNRLLERSQQPSVRAVATAVGQATQDTRLLSLFENSRGINLMPMPPSLRRLQPLNRTELADAGRVIRIRETFEPEEALQKIDPILRQRPNSPIIQAIGADLEYKIGELEEARVRLDRVRSQQIADYEFWLIDAMVHSEIYTSDRSDSDALTQADTSVQRALLINPDVPEAHQIRAMVHEQQGNLHEAQLSFETASDLNNEVVGKVRMLSESLRCMALAGELTQALNQLDKLSTEYGEEISAPRIEAAVIAFRLEDEERFLQYFEQLNAESKAIVNNRIGIDPIQ